MPTVAFNCCAIPGRCIVHVGEPQAGARNDKTISRLDEWLHEMRTSDAMQNFEYELRDVDGNLVICKGAWFLVDGGYHRWVDHICGGQIPVVLRPIKLVTDHQPLVWLMNADQKKNAHHTRWALMVDQYDLVVVHRAGASHANADVPSRFPLASDEDHTGSRLDSGDEVKVGGNIRLATPKEYAAWYGAVAENPGNAAVSVDEKRVIGAAVALRISRQAMTRTAPADCEGDRDVATIRSALSRSRPVRHRHRRRVGLLLRDKAQWPKAKELAGMFPEPPEPPDGLSRLSRARDLCEASRLALSRRRSALRVLRALRWRRVLRECWV
ncbi:hypothetical protein RI054_20g89660 [Pseudoscourfieldia marina]